MRERCAQRAAFVRSKSRLLNGTPIGDRGAGTHQLRRCMRVVPFFMEDGYFSRVAIAAAKVGDRSVQPDDRFAMPEDAGDSQRRAGSSCVRRSASMTAWPV